MHPSSEQEVTESAREKESVSRTWSDQMSQRNLVDQIMGAFPVASTKGHGSPKQISFVFWSSSF